MNGVLPQVENLEFRVLWLLKKPLLSREEPDISLSVVNSKARFHHVCYMRINIPP